VALKRDGKRKSELNAQQHIDATIGILDLTHMHATH